MKYILSALIILSLLITACGKDTVPVKKINIPDYLTSFESKQSHIQWFSDDFEYKYATLNMQTGATLVTINLSNGKEKQINGGTFFSNILFQDSSLPKILKACNPSTKACTENPWVIEKQVGYNVFTTAYCPISQKFCRNIVDYYTKHSSDCGAIEGINMRCLDEDWDKDLEHLGTIGRIIR